MELFSHLLIVVSIILGLGATELLGGVVRMLRGDLKPAPLHTLWIVIILQAQLQMAWAIWGLRIRTEWRYPEFGLLLLGPLLLYIAAAVLFPGGQSSEALDEHLLRRRHPFFLLNAAYVLVTGLYSWFLYREGWVPDQTSMRLAVAAVFVTLAFNGKRRVQWALGLLILAGHLWFTYVHTFVLSATPAGATTETGSASITDLSQADIAAIRATSERWLGAVREQRWEDAAATFTEDAILWVAGTPHQGRLAILTFHKSMAPFDPTRKLHISEIHGRGDMAFVSGYSTITPESGGAPVVVARYLDVRVREADGVWRFWRDMVIPLPAPTTPKQ